MSIIINLLYLKYMKGVCMFRKRDSAKPKCIIKHDTQTNDIRINTKAKQTFDSIMIKSGIKKLNDTEENENGKCNE